MSQVFQNLYGIQCSKKVHPFCATTQITRFSSATFERSHLLKESSTSIMTYGYRSRFPKYDEQQREILSVLVLPRRLSPSRRVSLRTRRRAKEAAERSCRLFCRCRRRCRRRLLASPLHWEGKAGIDLVSLVRSDGASGAGGEEK